MPLPAWKLLSGCPEHLCEAGTAFILPLRKPKEAQSHRQEVLDLSWAWRPQGHCSPSPTCWGKGARHKRSQRLPLIRALSDESHRASGTG